MAQQKAGLNCLIFMDGQVPLILYIIFAEQEISVETSRNYFGQCSCSVSYYSVVILSKGTSVVNKFYSV